MNNYGNFPFYDQYRLIHEVLKDLIPCIIKIVFSITTYVLFIKALNKKSKMSNENDLKDEVEEAERLATIAVLIISFVSILYHIPSILFVIDFNIYAFTKHVDILIIEIILEIANPICMMIITFLNLIDKNFRNELKQIFS